MKKLNFDGYYRNPDNLPHESGIYVVHACGMNPSTNTIVTGRIIYIGQADDLHDRHVSKSGKFIHERLTDFKKEAYPMEEVFYSYAEVPKQDLDIVENALVVMQQPMLNVELKGEYKHQKESFKLYGTISDFKKAGFGFLKDYDASSIYSIEDTEI